jgi:hypothetical protein
MPKTIDVLIGLSLVMLVVSLAVTAITQFLLAVLNSRGRNLGAGLANLLRQIDPKLTEKLAQEISTGVLTHPLVAGSFGGKGAVVHREEFTKLLMDLGSGEGLKTLDSDAQEALKLLLTRNGIDRPSETLASIRLTALELERTHPELAEDARHTMAIIANASSHLVAKVNSWFDRTIDRVKIRFTVTTRTLTFLSALLVAFVVQLDAFALINGLSVNDQLRTQLAAQAIKGINIEQGKASSALSDLKTSDVSQNLNQYLGNLAQFGVIKVPHAIADYAGWPDKLPGILFSVLLLSLGAPFWYTTLSTLLRLRSALAEKDDVQRDMRQSAQKVGGSEQQDSHSNTAGQQEPLPEGDEQGDLAAKGAGHA